MDRDAASEAAWSALRALAVPDPPVGPPRYRLWPELLGTASDELLDRVVDRRVDFSHNDPGGMGYRRGQALAAVPDLTDSISALVHRHLDEWCVEFGIDVGVGPARDAVEIAEVAVTAFGDGDFLGPHIDDGRGFQPNGRVLSFVYWMYRRPRRFTGGELRLCGWAEHEGRIIPGPPAVDLEPGHDTLIVFPSATMHEVFPVHSDSDQFADARFAITGFVRRPVR